MRLCEIDKIKGGEVLARPIMTENYQVLLSEGTVIKKEYLEKFRELNIVEVYIKEDINSNNLQKTPISVQKIDIEENYKNKVKLILEKHIYQNSRELVELGDAADHIINDILKDENVVEEIIEIRERSEDIYEHSISCCILSTLVALRLKLDYEKVHDIGVACLLHEIGFRYLSENFTDKDMKDMSQIEIAEYKKHPVFGYSALKSEKWISDRSKNIVLYHHEKLDGSGYPLHARDIFTEARIVGICDTFDEMICGIGCKRVKIYEAIEYLKTFKNIKFDGKIVDEFLKFTAVYPTGSKVKTNEGEIGVVIKQNKNFPERPVLQIVKDKNGRPLPGKNILDLLKAHHVFVDKVLN